MPQIIPGGRPRSSSDGDILDEDFCSTLVVNLNNRNYVDEPRKTSFTNINSSNTSTSTNNLNTSDDSSFDSDSKLSSRSQSSSRVGRKGLTFKSMRKAVSRVFVKDSKFNDSAVKKPAQVSGLSKVWTPDLRHLSSKPRSNELSYSGTLSTARPLITKSNMGMAVPKWKTTPGAVGIYNHGNNCFMNTILQCLSNTDSFTEYFIRDFFKNDLKNSSNGKKGVFRSSHGEVTEQLANFLKCLWSGKYSSDVSKEFKAVVGKFNNQYKGDDQNDAQEFLLWLLDCIHEDVSTFTKKKVKPQKTPVGKTDKELASEAASANGESFILKLFQALHSSTLTCPTCGERSSTFDPYLCVSLPLPQRCLRVIYVIVVYLDLQDVREVKMAFTLNQNDGIRELRAHVAADTRIPLQQLLLVQLKDDCFGATYTDDQPLLDVPENEVVYAIEAHPDNASMSSSTQEFDSPTSQVLLIHVEITDKSAHSYRFGSPAMLQVRRDITWKNLQVEILKKMGDSVCEEIFSKTQKLSSLFLLRVYDGRSRKFYLPSDVDMPLYSQCAERAYTIKNGDSGPSHIKIIAEWDPSTKSRVVVDDQEHIEGSPSITKVQNCPPGQGKVSLQECFRLYTQEEKLIGDDAWLCPYCKRQQQGTIKTLGLWSLPEILVLHLKRFKQTGPRRSKLNTLIDFPIDSLDMSSYLSHKSLGQPIKADDYIYDLMGVSNHYGNMMGGHYTAYCRNPIDGKWREYNDAKVRSLEGPVATREAYILFYQRRSLSKNVNQRLFMGDHWIYSLPLAPSDRTGDISTSEKSTNLSLEHTHQSPFSRSRSASPSTRRQVNKGWNTHCLPTYSLTPQPVRRPIMPYTNGKASNDDTSSTSSSLQISNTNQRSRPKQRQSSDSHSENMHDARSSSFVRPRDSTRVHVNRSSPEKDNEGFVGKNKLKPNPKININRIQPEAFIRTTSTDMSPAFTSNRQDSPGNKYLSSDNSKTVIHHSQLNSATLKSQATSPVSSDPASVPQTKHNGRNVNQTSKSHRNSPPLSDAENAGKKLALIMKQDIMSKACVKADSLEEHGDYVRSDTKNIGTDTIRGAARLKQVNKENLGEVSLAQTSTNDHSHRLDSFTSDTKNRGDEFKRNNQHSFKNRVGHRNTDSSLSTKDNITDPDLSVEPELKEKLQNEIQVHKFRQQPEEHSGGKNGLIGYRRDHKRAFRFADDTAIWNSESSPLLSHDVPHQSKSATISRTYNTSQSGRFERSSIPHSNTDHDIHYNNYSFGPPPSPTPPHSLREEQTFNNADVSSSLSSTTSDYFTSSHQLGRDAHSTQSSEFSRQHSSHQNSPTSSGTRTFSRHVMGSQKSRYNFYPPREARVVKTEPVRQNIANIFTPCVRESSV